MFFLSNLILILLIPIYFAFNLFSNWILFFNFIPNNFILIFFVEFDPHFCDCNFFYFCDCNFFYFEFFSWLIFFGNFIPHYLISLNFHIIFDIYFFYHAFKTRPGSWPPSYLGSRVRLNDGNYQGQSEFFFIMQEVKMILFW